MLLLSPLAGAGAVSLTVTAALAPAAARAATALAVAARIGAQIAEDTGNRQEEKEEGGADPDTGDDRTAVLIEGEEQPGEQGAGGPHRGEVAATAVGGLELGRAAGEEGRKEQPQQHGRPQEDEDGVDVGTGAEVPRRQHGKGQPRKEKAGHHDDEAANKAALGILSHKRIGPF